VVDYYFFGNLADLLYWGLGIGGSRVRVGKRKGKEGEGREENREGRGKRRAIPE